MPAFRRRFLCALLAPALAAVMLGACGDDDSANPSPSSTTDASETTPSTTTDPGAATTSGPKPTFPPVQPGEGVDAEGRVADAVITARYVAQQVGKEKQKATNLDEFEKVVQQQLSGVEFVGPEETASPSAISTDLTVLDPSKPADDKNVKVLVFAITDPAGECVGVMYWGYPEITGSPDKLVSFTKAPITCNAIEAKEWLRPRFATE
jgi:hypothetical protein